jgi:hypothetical protein
MRFVRLRLSWRLDATEGATEVVQFAFIGELLTFCDFHQFQNFINSVSQLPE